MTKKVMRTDYPVQEIAKDTYKISDFGIANCYLLVGQDKALLIDCGLGIGDIKGCAERITDKPIIVVGTHGHVDHVGGDGAFDEIYLHTLDTGRNYRFQTSKTLRKLFLLASKGVVDKSIKSKDLVIYKKRPRVIGIEDGHVFSLGGRDVKVVHSTGHTLGSVLLIDDNTKIAFVGDNMSPSLWLFLPHASTVEEWLVSVKKIRELANEHRIFWGHEGGELSASLIDRDIQFANEILAKYKRNRHVFFVKFYPCNDRVNGSIVFRVSRIFKKKKR